MPLLPALAFQPSPFITKTDQHEKTGMRSRYDYAGIDNYGSGIK
jgi:hypothetical protein